MAIMSATNPRPPMWTIRALEVWHGLFAGSYLVAFWTGEGPHNMHFLGGYLTMGLLAVRFSMAAFAPRDSPFGLPWASPREIAAFGKACAQKGILVLLNRHPLLPVSGLALLSVAVVVVVTGVLPTGGDEAEQHGALANLSLLAIAVHVGLIVTSRMVRRSPAFQKADRVSSGSVPTTGRKP